MNLTTVEQKKNVWSKIFRLNFKNTFAVSQYVSAVASQYMPTVPSQTVKRIPERLMLVQFVFLELIKLSIFFSKIILGETN